MIDNSNEYVHVSHWPMEVIRDEIFIRLGVVAGVESREYKTSTLYLRMNPDSAVNISRFLLEAAMEARENQRYDFDERHSILDGEFTPNGLIETLDELGLVEYHPDDNEWTFKRVSSLDDEEDPG